jgi:AcrR family transcriptional regulator
VAKQKRDAKATKAKIIKNAMELFSKNGYDATTADEIAKESGVNKALIYYYFKNKAGLYERVMSGLFHSIHDDIVQAEKCCNNPMGELKSFVQTYAKYAQKEPFFPALLLRELSDNGSHIPDMMFSSMLNLFSLLSDILKRGEEEGVFKSSIPMVIHFMILGPINLLVTTEELRKKAVLVDKTIDTCSECSMDEIADYIVKTIQQILEVENNEQNITCD